jgi:hypothetical protein
VVHVADHHDGQRPLAGGAGVGEEGRSKPSFIARALSQ